MLRRQDLKFVATDKIKDESKFKFQGQSARSQRWFDLEFDWIEVNFSTCAPDLYRKPFQSHEDTQDINAFKLFQVPIANKIFVESFKFQNDVPIIKYCQKSLNSCCFSSLASSFAIAKQNKAANAISLRIKESLESEVVDRIDFANAIFKNKKNES